MARHKDQWSLAYRRNRTVEQREKKMRRETCREKRKMKSKKDNKKEKKEEEEAMVWKHTDGAEQEKSVGEEKR